MNELTDTCIDSNTIILKKSALWKGQLHACGLQTLRVKERSESDEQTKTGQFY